MNMIFYLFLFSVDSERSEESSDRKLFLHEQKNVVCVMRLRQIREQTKEGVYKIL